MTKTARNTYRPGDTDLFDLFDTNYMRHVCEAIADCCDPVPPGWRAGLAQALKTKLMPVVSLMIARLWEDGRGTNASEYSATERFGECVENIADLIVGAEGRGVTRDDARGYAESLRLAWTTFIAEASAHRMYDDLPRDLATAERTSAVQREKARKLRKAKTITKGDVESFLSEYERKEGHRQGAIKAACRHFDVSSKTLAKRLKE